MAWLVREANRKKVMVKTADGRLKRVPAGEVVLEKAFQAAIKGNIAMQKILFKHAKKYIPEPPPLLSYEELTFMPISQENFDFYKAFGCLPAGCSDGLKEISIKNLTLARKTFSEIWEKLSATPEGIEARNRITDTVPWPEGFEGPPAKSDPPNASEF